MFIGEYASNGGEVVLTKTSPREPNKNSFAEIDQISPQFTKIFNEAAAAETFGLSELAGLGYRKALEFLVKDYCIHKAPDDTDAIKKEFLGAVIRNRIPDRKIMLAAQRAAWLGNDETHYIREWTTHDIDDLKKLLGIAVSGIREDVQFEEYEKQFAQKPRT